VNRQRLLAGLAAPAALLMLARRLCTVVTVRGFSMQPTLADGERVLAVRQRHYPVGAIVVFRVRPEHEAPGDPDFRVKRVAAIGGQPRPAAFAGSSLAATVPAGHVAIAGDNTGRSEDSRHLGYVPVSSIRGRVVGRR